jgi:hypothetical protein
MRALEAARVALARHEARTALASARRAAGMGWNAVLALEEVPDPAFGVSYADHLRALSQGIPVKGPDASTLPDEVRAAAKILMQDPAAGPRRDVVQLLTPKHDDRLLASAEVVLAEAYARVLRRRPTGTH